MGTGTSLELFLMYACVLQCFETLRAYMINENSTPLLIVGGPGTGKSTILAKWYVLCIQAR